MRKNRDIVNHMDAGKGDANRSPLNKTWRENYDAIDWYKRRVGAIGREFQACNKTIANMERKKKGLLKQSKRIWKIIDK